MSNGKVSVIVPVYNVEAYVRECIDSLLAQDMPGLELIFVNDGSTDGSRGILEEYSRMYDNIIVIDQENSGQSVAKNNGIKVASGKYISFVDADDIMRGIIIGNMFGGGRHRGGFGGGFDGGGFSGGGGFGGFGGGDFGGGGASGRW